MLTCDVASIGVQPVDIQLQWFNQHGVEIVDVAAPRRLLAILWSLLAVYVRLMVMRLSVKRLTVYIIVECHCIKHETDESYHLYRCIEYVLQKLLYVSKSIYTWCTKSRKSLMHCTVVADSWNV